jgi:hypothetical protein
VGGGDGGTTGRLRHVKKSLAGEFRNGGVRMAEELKEGSDPA